LAKHTGAGAEWVTESRHAREIPAGKTLDAIRASSTSQADNTGTRRSTLAGDAYGRGTPSRSGTIHSSILIPDCAWRLVKDGAAGDPDDTAAALPAAPSRDAISMEISLANNGI
jgi:hypothetical protein